MMSVLYMPVRFRPICFLWLLWLAQSSPLVAQPNIILILADDLGFGDLGCYGSELVQTPRLDRLAAEGVRLTDFYVASPFCSPSRAALLTGRLPARCGVPYVLFPSEHTGLPPDEVTMAEMLKGAGYATACIGKWHLGWRRELRPQNQGFDEFFGVRHSNDADVWSPGRAFHQLTDFEAFALRDGDHIIEQPVDQAFLTEKYTQRALDFIRRHRQQPFFLYLPHTMPHIPQYASPAFAGKSKGGVYGDSIAELDASTGRILDLLDELDLAGKTLVLFTSDNGAAVKSRVGNQAKSPTAQRFQGHAHGGSNGPLKMGKGTTWEGGVRVPCMVRWPGVISRNRVDSTPSSTLDLWPTFAALAGVKLPAEVLLDGRDISAWLKAAEAPRGRERLLTHYFGVQLQAVRVGDWKLILPISELPRTRVDSLWFAHQTGVFERQHRVWPEPVLYDLKTDLGEQTNVVAAHPQVVERLLREARAFDASFQPHFRPLLRLPGPAQPAPGQIRSRQDDITPWLQLIHEPTRP